MSNGDIRAVEILRRFGAGPLTGVEVGVFAGETSAELLQRRPDLTLHLVDAYKTGDEWPLAYRQSGDYHANTLSKADQEGLKAQATRATEFAGSRRNLHWVDSVEAAMFFEDASLDFVFIDADHSYEGCAADIAAWAPKIRPGGVLCGHDYALPILPGPKRAVDEAVEKHGWTLELGENYTWFVRL